MRIKINVFIFSIILLINLGNMSAIDEQTVESKIIHVIVYPEWAYVTRKANLNMQKGINAIAFKHLPTWIDTESIEIKILSTADNKIINTVVKTEYLRQITEKDVAVVRDKVTELKNNLEDIRTELKAIEEERKFLNGFFSWKSTNAPDEREARKIDVEEVVSFNNFLKKALLENLKKENDLNRKIKDIKPVLESWEKKWNELQSKANLEEKEIAIEIESNGGNAEIFIRYLISGASWYPVYDARTDTDSKNVQIGYDAIVQQSTGEDWSDAEFTLSTIKPYLIREKPELNPWFVNSFNEKNINNYNYSRSKNEEYSSNLEIIQKKQNEMINKGNVFEQKAYQDYRYNYEKAIDVIQQVEERGTIVEFNIKGKYSVKTDGKPVRLIIGDAKLDVKNYYVSIPVVSKSTYVSGIMKNISNFPFLPGVVNVYKAGNFIGKSKINFVAEQEKFELYMGLEERIKVSRKLDIKKSSTTILGAKKNIRVGYNIEVQNYLKDSISIEIKDQIPVSQKDSIKIRLLTSEPKVDKIDNGILSWNVNLNSQEKKNIYFEFDIEYPKDVVFDDTFELEKQLKNLSE